MPCNCQSRASVFIDIRAQMMRFVSRYFSNQQAVEDVVQEACVKALEAQRQTNIQNPKAYLFSTARNLALKELAKSMNRLTDCVEDDLLESVLESTPGVDVQCEARERLELFCRAVRTLPVKCRRVFVLRKVYGFSQMEIAEHLKISVKTVEAHIAKGSLRCTEFVDAIESSPASSGPSAIANARN